MSRFQTMEMPRQDVKVTNAYMRGVYRWMSAGLGITAVTAFLVASSPALLQAIFGNSMMAMIVMASPLVFVLALSFGIHKMSATTATGLFIAYSAVMGVSLSTILLVYAQQTIALAFVSAAGMFLAMSVYGATTKKDLTSMGSFMFMGLIGIVIASIVNMFVGSSMMHFIISIIGVIVFTGLTAYDTQRIKMMGETAPMNDTTAIRRGTIMGALSLYLNFINLFMMLLSLFGGSRD